MCGTLYSIPANIVEGSNDWEEIKEFPKILAFRIKKNGTISKLFPNGCYSVEENTDGNVTLNEMLYGKYSVEDGFFEIYQVQNETGEIFTIGDNIEHKTVHLKGRITKIGLIDDEIYFGTTYNEGNMGTIFDNAIKVKKPLFSTEDGIEVFEGDNVFWVIFNTDKQIWKYAYPLSICAEHKMLINNKNLYKIFSSQNAAEKYTDEDKLVFSKKQIKDAINNTFKNNEVYMDLIGFKQKLGIK
jgi:hypothetical protein